MNLTTLFTKFPNEESCMKYLEKTRWSNGVECPYCSSNKISKHVERERRDRMQCQSCLKSFSVTVGTIFHRTHLDLRHWFYIIFLTLDAKKSLSASQISPDLGIRRATVWSVMRKIRRAMGTEQKELLEGILKIDGEY